MAKFKKSLIKLELTCPNKATRKAYQELMECMNSISNSKVLIGGRVKKKKPFSNQDMLYNLRFLNEPRHRNNNFYWQLEYLDSSEKKN